MNSRPILIATCIAIALVAFVYFVGKQQFALDDTAVTQQTSKPVTVNKSPTPSESLEPEASETSIPTEQEDAPLQQDTENTTHTSSSHKDLTYEQSERYSEWFTHYNKLLRRLSEHAGKEIALAEAMIQSSEDERAVIRSFFNLMPPAQIQALKSALLKVHPRDEVESFFEAVANDPARTPAQIVAEAQRIIDTDELNNLIFEQLGYEFKQIQEELRASEREYAEIMKGDNE